MSESTPDKRSILGEGAAELGLTLTADQLNQFLRYENELVDWNLRMNLTAIEEPVEIEVRHFLDSLTLVAALPRKVRSGRAVVTFLDVGAGAGLPGIPLAIVLPMLQVTLLEATQKKCRFLNHVRDLLTLPNLDVRCGRAEELAHDSAMREHFDVVAARAVAPLATLAELCLPFARPGGRFVAMKKTGIDTEIDRARYGISVLGGRVAECLTVRVPRLNEDRLLVVVEKLAPTPRGYPRRPGVPAKAPLEPRR